MHVRGPDELMQAVLRPALEVLTACSIAEAEADPSVFRQAMDRVIGDAADAPDPRQGLAQMMFGLFSLSSILLDELAQVTGQSTATCCAGYACATSTRTSGHHADPVPRTTHLAGGAGDTAAGAVKLHDGEAIG